MTVAFAALAVSGLVRQAGYLGLFAVVLLENLVPPIPSEVVLPFAGWEISEGRLAAVPAGVGFGLANPAVFTLMYAAPHSGDGPPAAAVAASGILAEHIHRIAGSGRLLVPEPRAADLVQAAGRGTTLTLIAMPEERRDPGLSELAREAVIAAITRDETVLPEPGPVGAAIALGAVLPGTDVLTAAERALLGEWLERITDAGRGSP